MPEWQADQASAHFEDIIGAAAAGAPQHIRLYDGKQVVVVSRDDFEVAEPNLRDYLLTSGYAEEHDEFDDALRKVRESGPGLFTAR
jgi:hypothetical protein